MINGGRAGQKSKNRFLAEYGWNHRYTDIQVHTFNIDSEMSVLRDSSFRNIQIAQNLDSGNQRCMDIFLQGHKVGNDAVHTHADAGLMLKRFDMYIGYIGIVGPDQNTVKQIDDWGIIVPLLNADFHGFGYLGAVCSRLLRRLSGRYLGIVILDGIFQRLLFAEHNLQIHSNHLTNIFNTIEIQGIIYQKEQAAAVHPVTQHAVFLCQYLGYHFHRIYVYGQIRYIHKLVLQTHGKCFQHLPLCNNIQRNQRTAHSDALVLLLIVQGFFYIVIVDVAQFLQYITDSNIFIVH